MQSFRNLKVWEKAHAVTLEVYKASRSFPKEEMYGLTSQMRRASASIVQISQKAHAGRATPNSGDFFKSRWFSE
jgi:four helix bundle protein